MKKVMLIGTLMVLFGSPNVYASNNLALIDEDTQLSVVNSEAIGTMIVMSENAETVRIRTETTAINLKLEKEKELADIIHGIYLSNPSDKFLFSHSFIDDNVQEITAISDLSQRRARVEDLYNKFKLFSSIYGREDLGVKATLADLDAVKNWLDKTNGDMVLMRYGHFEFSQGKDPHDLGFNGRIISKPLFEAKSRLQTEIDREKSKGHDVTLVQSQLNDIFQKYPEADMFLYLVSKLSHTYGEISLFNSNNENVHGHIALEWTGSRWFGRIEGIFWQAYNSVPIEWKRGSRWGAPNPVVFIWENFCVPRRNSDLSATVNAIKQRAMLLFDFETNPESELQKFYKEAGIVPALTLPFPSMEIDSLIKQCNDFIKRSIS